jgi:hypothetical protein
MFWVVGDLVQCKGPFRHEIVAIKACDILQAPHYEAEILTEIDIYMALERLQGDVIP